MRLLYSAGEFTNYSDFAAQNVMKPGYTATARFFSILCLSVFLLGQLGCNSVKRRIIVRTQPEGALVSIDRQAIGYSPVSVPFDYYGSRLIQLEKDGFETIEVEQRIAPPFYDSFPISFFTENFSPRERRDNRVLDFQLVPKQQPNESQLIERANRTRDNIRRGTITAPIKR